MPVAIFTEEKTMFHEFSPASVRPAGWYRDQLILEAKGLSGNLDKMWPDVSDSAWIGGSHEGWERVPYWLDGFLPLGFLLGDDDLLSRGKRYVDAILARQRPDGWICPCEDRERADYDIWSCFLIGKVLTLYYTFTGEARVKDALYRAMKCLHGMMRAGSIRLFEWGKARWFEAMIPLCFLYEEYGEEWIRDLGKLLEDEGLDWNTLRGEWIVPKQEWSFERHVVNIAMMFKYRAAADALAGEPVSDTLAEDLWQYLAQYNGTPAATFNGDECLAGIGPSHGFELCSVCELMYSYELLYFITGEGKWADRLEKAAFNALPATISDDMWRHQYDQMTNQLACVAFDPDRSPFTTNGKDAMLFGVEPFYGCCTANMAQGWPKLGLHAFRQEADGIGVALLLPSSLTTEIAGVPVRVEIETEYPFRMSAVIRVTAESPAAFTLRVRIPGHAVSYAVDGVPASGRVLELKRTWTGTEEIALTLRAAPRLVERPNGLSVLEYGPLLFSLPLEVREEELPRKEGQYIPDTALHTDAEWRYGFASDRFEVIEKDGDSVPFSSKAPRLVIRTKLARVAWETKDGFDTVAEDTPVSPRAVGAPEEFELWPYGCAKLRMTEMPKTE